MFFSSIPCILGDITLPKDVAKVPNNPLMTSLPCILGDTTRAKNVAKSAKNPV
jgi:hypothetical protein